MTAARLASAAFASALLALGALTSSPAVADERLPAPDCYRGLIVSDENANRLRTEAFRRPFCRTRNEGQLFKWIVTRRDGPVVYTTSEPGYDRRAAR